MGTRKSPRRAALSAASLAGDQIRTGATALLADDRLEDPGEDAAKLVQCSLLHLWVMTANLVKHLLCLWCGVVADQLAATMRLQRFAQ